MVTLFFIISLFFHVVCSHKAQCVLSGVVKVDQQTVWTCYSIQLIVVACLCILIGIYFMSLGFPLFIISMGITGLVFGSIVTWVVLNALESSQEHHLSPTFYLLVSLGVGFVCSITNVLCWRIGLFLLCGVAGYCFSFFVWSWKENFIVEHALLRHSISLSVALLFAVSTAVMEFVTVIMSLSFLGAWVFVFGLDLLLQTGFSNCAVQLLLNPEKKHLYYTINNKVYSMLAGVIVLWFVACIWQWFFNRGKRFGLRVIENTNNTLNIS